MGLLKWKTVGHLRAACLQHASDLEVAARAGDLEKIRKELADLSIIFGLAFEAEETEALLKERRAKFEATAHLPPLG